MVSYGITLNTFTSVFFLMKERLLLLALLLVTVVGAQNNIESNYENRIPRYDNISLDNIHILRLQEASLALGTNVSSLKEDLLVYEEQRANELSQLHGSMDSFQRSIIAQVSALQNSVDRLSDQVDGRPDPAFAVPAEITFPPYMIILLGLNVFLLILVIVLIFWLREQYYVHRVTHAEEHIHPAPPELIAYVKHQFEHSRKLKDIRIELASKGWSPSLIEHAIHAAKEK